MWNDMPDIYLILLVGSGWSAGECRGVINLCIDGSSEINEQYDFQLR